jgi:transcriptional regulator with XRE-family HTH domain
MANEDMHLKKAPGAVDRHVGGRVRMRRISQGLSQERLGEALGVTFQQIQKYEKGSNRISVSRMQQIAQVLGCTVNYFLEGAPREAGMVGFAESDQAPYSADLLSTPEGLALAKAFTSISDPRVRRRVVDLVTTLAEGSNRDPA